MVDYIPKKTLVTISDVNYDRYQDNDNTWEKETRSYDSIGRSFNKSSYRKATITYKSILDNFGHFYNNGEKYIGKIARLDGSYYIENESQNYGDLLEFKNGENTTPKNINIKKLNKVKKGNMNGNY